LRFGVQPLQFLDVMQRIVDGFSVDLSKFSFPDFCITSVMEGFRHVELTMDIEYILPGSLKKDTFRKLIDLGESLGITYSVHLPLWSVELASPNPFVRRGSVESMVHSIELAKDLNPECYVIHITGALASEFTRLNIPRSYKYIVNKGMLSNSIRSLEEIVSKIDIPSRKIAVENVEFPFDLTREAIDRFDLSICLDTGHLLAGFSDELSIMDFLDKHYDRLIEIHLHDGFFRVEHGLAIRRDHLPLGEGDLPLVEFMKYLQFKGFRGPIVFELSLRDSKRSLDVLRNTCPWVTIE